MARRSLGTQAPRRARRSATRAWLASLPIVLASLSLHPIAHAQPAAASSAAPSAAPSAEVQAEARRLFEAGRDHADAERWPDAVTAFEGSRALLERPSTLFNLASALVRVGRALDALETVEALERIADPDRDRALLSGMAELRARAESSLRHVVLTVTPDTAIVEVDGQPVEGAGARRELMLDPGPHAATVSLRGFTTERVDIALGQDAVAVTLRPRAARVHVEPSLTSAAVSVDGIARGLGVVDIELEPGQHVLEVTAHGHETLTREIEVEPGDELTVAADLVRVAVVVEAGPDVPLILGLTLGGVLVIAGLATALGVAYGTTTEAPSGGTANTVIAVPLTSPMGLRF